MAHLLPREPRDDDGRRFIRPRHEDGPGNVQRYHRARLQSGSRQGVGGGARGACQSRGVATHLRCRHRRHERVVGSRQVEVRAVRPLQKGRAWGKAAAASDHIPCHCAARSLTSLEGTEMHMIARSAAAAAAAMAAKSGLVAVVETSATSPTLV